MKKISTFAALLLMAAAAMFSTSCENDNINPYDYVNNGGNGSDGNENQGSKDVITTKVAEYPKGSLVWSKDTTLSESVEIPVGTSLYIEPGVTVTCKSEVQVPVEIVVLGNLYCLGTAEKPVTITSDTKKPADWGGIICGYNSEEVVLNTWMWLMPVLLLPRVQLLSRTNFSRPPSMAVCQPSTSVM